MNETATAATAAPGSLKQRAVAFYHVHEPACTAALFVFGFLFDTLFVGRIDKLHNILHQASYLLFCAFLIGFELRQRYGAFTPPPRLHTAWQYHKGATHFMLGTLLNIYTLFYFKSASLKTSFLFLLVLAALLAINELKPFGGQGTTLRMSLFSLCLISYFTYLVPLLAGALGALAFLGGLAAASLCAYGLVYWLRPYFPAMPQVLWRHVTLPFGVVAALFAALYFAKAIPPVPLSLSAVGIYHDARVEAGKWLLTSTRPRWKFWQRGDQTFHARPGDKIHCFISVFSPTGFKERLQVRWLYKDPAAGWQQSDAIPLTITGGRDEGFRGETVKANYRPGRWRVRVETSDRRELGRIDVDVVADASAGQRRSRVIVR